MNKLGPSLFLAFKSISRGSKTTVILMVFVMTLAFVNLVFIASIMSGLLVAIDDQIRTNFVSDIVIEPQKEPVIKSYIKNAPEVRDRVEAIPGISSAAYRYGLSGTIGYDKDKHGNYVYESPVIVGVDPESELSISQIPHSMIAGQYLSSPGRRDIILGSDLAGGYKPVDDPNSLGGVKVGEKVTIDFANGISDKFTVRGIFRTGFAPVDAMAFVTDKAAESVLSVTRSATKIVVKLDQPGTEQHYMEQIRILEPDLDIRSWTEYIGVVGDLSTSFNLISAVVQVIGLIVASVTIFMLIYINVRHKRRQVGILKAIGIPHDLIIYSYIFQTVFYWLCGTCIGLCLIFFIIAPYFSTHPLQTPIGDTGLNISNTGIFFNIISLLAATFVGGLIPAWRGSRENILASIRGA